MLLNFYDIQIVFTHISTFCQTCILPHLPSHIFSDISIMWQNHVWSSKNQFFDKKCFLTNHLHDQTVFTHKSTFTVKSCSPTNLFLAKPRLPTQEEFVKKILCFQGTYIIMFQNYAWAKFKIFLTTSLVVKACFPTNHSYGIGFDTYVFLFK